MLKVKDLFYGDKFTLLENGKKFDVTFVARRAGFLRFKYENEEYLVPYQELNNCIIKEQKDNCPRYDWAEEK